MPNLYGIIIASSVLLGYLIARKIAPRFSISKKDIDDVLPWIVIFGMLGARLYYVAFSWDYFGSHPVEILEIWKGGLAIYGAIIGAAVGIFLFCRRRGIAVLSLLDPIAIVLPLGQALGRWGNFFNQEAFGAPTDLPWGIYIDPEHRPFEYLGQTHFHPTFFYESLWNLGVFFVLLFFARKNKTQPDGFFVGLYFILYGIGRFAVESLRLDSFFVFSLRADQITSALIAAAGIGILLKCGKSLMAR